MHLCNLSLSRHDEVRRAEVWRGLEGPGMVRRGMARYGSRPAEDASMAILLGPSGTAASAAGGAETRG